MSLRCFVIVVCLFLAAHAALIKSKNIPVEIVYERSDPSFYASRNLDAKPQLSSDAFLKLKLSEDIINEGKDDVVEAQVDEVSNEYHGNPYGVRNLDAKIQLSPEELGQGLKLAPNTEEKENEVKSEQVAGVEGQEVKPDNVNLISLLKKAEEIAYSGINSIRDNIDKASDAIANAKPSQQSWEKLNQTLEKFFSDQYRGVILKQDKPPDNNANNQNNNQNNQGNEFLQNIVNGFQTTMTNWVGNYFQQNNTQKPQGSEDEQGAQNQGGQNQGPWQNFVNFVSTGVSQVVNNINNLNQQSSNGTGQEDTGTGSSGGQNIFGNVVSTFQQFFGGQGNQGSNPAQSSNNQSDTGVQPPNQGNILQQAFNQVVNNFRPTPTTKAPVQGDEGTASSTTQASNILGSISQAFQNFVGSTLAPQGGAGGSGGSNPILSGAQAIGGQFGQVIGGQGGNGGGGGSNPISSGAQAIGSQIGQLVPGGGAAGGGQGSNPLTSGAQAIGSQVGQLVGGQGGGNPLENIQNQLGGSTAGASSKEKEKVVDAKVEDVTPTPTAAPAEKLKEEKIIETAEKIL